MKSFSTLMNVVQLGTQFTKWDLTYLLIALFLLNQCRIFFLGNLDGPLHCLMAGAFAIHTRGLWPTCFSNFPRLLLSSDRSSNCVSFCFASRVLWLISLLLMLPVVLSEITCDSKIRVLLGSLKVSLVHLQKAHYLSHVSLEDQQVNVWRSERHFAFNDHNHTAYLQSFNQFWLR